MTPAEYGLGLLVFAGTTGGAFVAGALLVTRRLGHVRGAARILAVGVVGIAALLLAHLAPGALGILSRWSALGVALALAAAATRLPARAVQGGPAPTAGAESARLPRALAFLAGTALLVPVLARTWDALGRPPLGVDATTFHLPVLASWMQTGSLWGVHQFDPNLANGNYPQSGDLLELALVLPWHDIAFAALDGPALLAGTVLAVAATARELGAAWASAALVGLLAVAAPVVLGSANGLTDPLLLFGLAAGLLFLVRDLRSPARGERLLAAVALGLALGTKWYGLWAVPAVLVAWGAAAVLAGRAPRAVLRAGGAVSGLALLAGGFWLVRNLVASGDPLFPGRVPLLWDAPRDVLRECFGFSLIDYVGRPSVWRDWILPGWREALALPGLAALLGLAGALVAAVRARMWTVLALGLAAVAMLLAYAATPYSALGPDGSPSAVGANARYAGPALILAAVGLGWMLGRVGPRARVALEVLVAVAIVQGAWKGALPGVGVVLAAALVVGGIAAVLLVRPRPLAVVVAATVVLAVGLGVRQDDLHGRDYRDRGGALAWLAAHGRAGDRVALAGVWDTNGPAAPLPALGPRLDRQIGYPGDPNRGLLQPFASEREWVRELHRGDYGLVLVGLDRSRYTVCPKLPGARVVAYFWALQARLEPVARDGRFALFRVPRAR